MNHRVTFVSLDAYPLLDAAASGGIGGAEVRAVTFAKGLCSLGKYSVDFVVADHPSVKRQASGFHIRPYKKHRPSTLGKLRRSLSKRMTGKPHSDRFFEELETEMVCCFGVRNDTASIIRAANQSGKRAILFLTSDRNIEDSQRSGRDRGIYGEIGHLCRYALVNADAVVVQSPFQQQELKRHLGIDGHLIRNPINLDRGDLVPTLPEPPVALWVGRADTFSKRADVCIEVAKRCPAIRFRMVMNNHHADTFDAIKASASANVEIIERVPFDEIESLFASVSILINTSSAEGFPNSFLQAAKFGKPIVSLQVDPGDMFASFGCGHCADGDIDRMVGEISQLCNNNQEYAEVSQRATEYVEQHHDARARCLELENLIDSHVSTTPKAAA